MLLRERDIVRVFFFFSSRRRHTRFDCDWSSDVCSSDLSLFLDCGYGVEGSGLSIRPPPVTRKQAGVPPPPQKLGRAGVPCGVVASVQATAASAIAAAPDQTRKLRWSIPKPLEESRVALVPLGPRG